MLSQHLHTTHYVLKHYNDNYGPSVLAYDVEYNLSQ